MKQIVTSYLQMGAITELVPACPSDPDFIVREAVERQWRLNRSLYLLVGEQWEWIDKQRWTEQQWESYVASEQLRTFVASWRSSTAGYYELRRDDAEAVEIAYFADTGFHRAWLRRRAVDRRTAAGMGLGCTQGLGSYLHSGPPRCP